MQPVKLHPHQEVAVEKLGNGKILCGATGVGKSITAMAYYVSKVCGGTYGDFGSMRTPKDVYVITTAKKRDSLDWEAEAIKFGISTRRDSTRDGVTITVDSWNNIGKYLEVEDAFFIFDEQRLVGSGAWAQTFIKIAKRNQWILLSATPGDTWLDYIPVFVANGWYKNRTAFKREHVVYSHYGRFPKVDRYINTNRLVRLRNQILVDMPYERHTVRHSKTILVDHDRDLFNKVVNQRWHVYEQRPLRDVAELFLVMRKVVNSDSSRLEAIRSLMSKHPKLIVFYNFDYELEMLRSLAVGSTPTDVSAKDATTSLVSEESLITEGHFGEDSFDERDYQTQTIPSRLSETQSAEGSDRSESDSVRSPVATDKTPIASFEIAEWNGHKHEPVPTSSSWLYLVQYTAGSEGWNCVETDAMCFYSLTYSWKAFWQSHGRIDRLNTPFIDLWYYTLVSNSVIDKAIQRALKAKRSFNERELHVKWDQ